MSRIIDANVILRYLLDDVPEQSSYAEEVIKKGCSTLPEVIAEVVYVLYGVYSLKRIDIADTLNELLDEVYVNDKSVIRKALSIFGKNNIDFVDAILVARSIIKKDEIVTFDKKINRMINQE